MRYLRRYNEDVEYDELLIFCEEILSYLLDKDFVLEINRHQIETDISINCISDDGFTNYMNIKSDFIPFIELLDKKYSIKNIEFYIEKDFYKSGTTYPTFDKSQIIDDEIDDDLKIRLINIIIKNN